MKYPSKMRAFEYSFFVTDTHTFYSTLLTMSHSTLCRMKTESSKSFVLSAKSETPEKWVNFGHSNRQICYSAAKTPFAVHSNQSMVLFVVFRVNKFRVTSCDLNWLNDRVPELKGFSRNLRINDSLESALRANLRREFHKNRGYTNTTQKTNIKWLVIE